ncbi:MAG: hypothetical protein JJD97_09790 [Gemmatimonadaceae bacterium]|nr:hypothetical protein [Gemmatimonadaceae bacterium]
MSLTALNRQTLRTAMMTALVIAAGACSDQSITSSAPPVSPPAPAASQAGMLRGTVREDGTIVLESLDPTIQVGDSNTSGAIYGNQNVTAKVTASNFTLVNSGGTKTWKFTLAVHNLLNYPVGSVDGGAIPYDTVGVFVFFPTAPSVVSPTNCGCTVTVQNTQGSANFSGINQKYYWYHDRLSAKGLAGDSTTNNPTWTFTAPSAVNSFRFTVLLSAPWPRGLQSQDTSWAVAYNPASDSIPDANASPRWKRIGLSYGGTNSASSSGLVMDVIKARGNSDDMFFYRADNLDRSENAYIEARLTLTSGGSNPVMILALVDSVKFVGLGIGNGKIGMVSFNQNSSGWGWVAGSTVSVTTTSAHVYRVGKFGATTSTVYVDGVEKFSTANNLLPNNFMPSFGLIVGPQAAHLSTFFGPTAQDSSAHVVVNYVNYAFHATPKPS